MRPYFLHCLCQCKVEITAGHQGINPYIHLCKIWLHRPYILFQNMHFLGHYFSACPSQLQKHFWPVQTFHLMSGQIWKEFPLQYTWSSTKQSQFHDSWKNWKVQISCNSGSLQLMLWTFTTSAGWSFRDSLIHSVGKDRFLNNSKWKSQMLFILLL